MEPSVKQPVAESQDRPRWLVPHAAYIHVPFCAHHCCYCDFAVVEGRDELADQYLDALECEIRDLGDPKPVETIFIGGGTPTHLQPRQLARLLQVIRQWFHGWTEFSIEANPATLTEEKLAVLAEHGVNRISLGGQSFQRHVLAFLERDHDAVQVERAVNLARRHIKDVSLDLIFGVPGQTLEQWRADLQAAVQLGVDHISTYGLTYEKGTRLWKMRERDVVQPLDEELERAMYAEAMGRLEAAGFEQYEISNFARRGHRCRHNEIYWANEAYFGFGLGAASYVDGKRATNTRDLDAYIKRVLAGESAMQQSERLEPEDRARETAMLNLRRKEGIIRAAFANQTGFRVDELLGNMLPPYIDYGWLQSDRESVHLTREGKFFADMICRDVWKE